MAGATRQGDGQAGADRHGGGRRVDADLLDHYDADGWVE